MKMVAAVILNFVTTSNLTSPSNSTLVYRIYLAFKFLWKSVKRFKSYSTFSQFQMATAAILDCVTMSNSTKLSCSTLQDLRYRTYLSFKFQDNRSSGLKVTVPALNSRRQPSPSWISSLRRIWAFHQTECNKTYLTFKFRDNLSNGLEVITVLLLNSRWRPTPSWIS